MVEIIKGLIGNSYLLAVITWVLFVIKIAINYWNTTEIERKLMTDLKRINGSISKFVVSSLLIIIISFIYIVINQKKYPEIDFNSENIFLIIVAVTVIFLLGGLVINFLVFCLDKAISIKYDYFILLSNSDRWKVIRMTDKSTLLIQKGDDETRLIKDWIDKSFVRVINKETWMYKLCGNKKKIKNVIKALSLMSTVLFILSIFLVSPWSLLCFFITMIVFLALIIVYGNFRIYSKINPNE